MANFTATDTFSDVVVLETTDQVLGGLPSSPSNKQAQALVNRTEWLKKRIGNREVVVRTLGAMDSLMLGNDMGKLVIVDSNSTNSVRDFNITIGTAGKVNGNTVTVYFRPNDTTLLIGTTNGSVRYFSGDLVEFIFDGTSFVGNIIHRDLATGTLPVSTFYSAPYNELTVPTISNNYYIPAIGAGDITRLQLQGENYPNIGTVIRLYNESGTSKIFRQFLSSAPGEFVLNTGVAYDSVAELRYVLEAGEYADFRLSSGNVWNLIENDISKQPLTEIISNGAIKLADTDYPSLKNWINEIINYSNGLNYIFIGDGDGLESPQTTTEWDNRCLRFGFTKIRNIVGGGFINPLPESFITFQPTPLPVYSLESYYLKNKEINVFGPFETGNYTIDIKFKVINKSISIVTTTFDLYQGAGLLNNYNTEDGSYVNSVTVILDPEETSEIHLYSNKFPYRKLPPVTGQNSLDPYIWVKISDNFIGSCSYKFRDAHVEIIPVY